jgi:hypothetical protein
MSPLVRLLFRIGGVGALVAGGLVVVIDQFQARKLRNGVI